MESVDRRRESLVAEVAGLPGTLLVPHRAGDLIFQDGAFAAGIYLVSKGLVMVGGYVPDEPRAVAVAGRGDLLGLEAWRSMIPPRYEGFARALTETELLFATADAWSRALDRPPFRELVLATLADLILDQRTLALHRSRPERALAWALVRWGEAVAGQGLVRFEIPAAILASVLGVSRSTLRQAVRWLADQGVAQQENGHIVGHLARLQDLLEETLTASLR